MRYTVEKTSHFARDEYVFLAIVAGIMLLAVGYVMWHILITSTFDIIAPILG